MNTWSHTVQMSRQHATRNVHITTIIASPASPASPAKQCTADHEAANAKSYEKRAKEFWGVA